MTPLYALVHEQLRSMFQNDPAGFIARARTEPDALLGALGTTERLAVYPTLFAGTRGAIFVLPTPAHIGEAFFAAASLAPRPRLYTLEAARRDGSDCTALCFWDGERHVVVGEGPESTIEDFAVAVDHHLRGMWTGPWHQPARE